MNISSLLDFVFMFKLERHYINKLFVDSTMT